MIKNYFNTAFRSFAKNKAYTTINIAGLVIGISFSCMLYVYVSNELSYDTLHTKSDRIFRTLTIDKRDPENIRRFSVSAPPLGPALMSNYPEVEDMVRLHRFTGQVVFEMNGQNFQERNWFTADPNFFNVFDYTFLSGDKATALKEPFSLVLTESMSKKYFGDRNPIGEIIGKCSFGPVKITGVIKDPPDNSHLQIDMLFSNVRTDKNWTNYLSNWESYSYIVTYTYIVLRERASIQALKSQMSDFQERHLGKFRDLIAFDFQPLEEIYLGSANIEEMYPVSRQGQRSYVYIFSSMGLFLLVIACINYINLATTKGMIRAREVGIRKVVGAQKGQLVVQFLTESLVITFVSMVIAIAVMDIVFPYFNQITGKEFDIAWETLPSYLPPLLTIALIIGFISGSYPAFYLAKLRPVASLRAREVTTVGQIGLRKILVIFQFVLTIVMIVSTMVVGQQMNFIQDKNIGFDKEHLMVIDINSGEVRSKFQTLKNEYAKIAGVRHAAVSTRVPGEWKNILELYVRTNTSADSLKTYFMGFDEDMLATYQMQLMSGRYFSFNGHSDSSSVLLNESAVKALKLTNPLGTVLKIPTDEGEVHVTVIGVLKDFHFQSLHEKIAPIVIGAWNSPFQAIDYFTLKVSGDIKKVIEAVTRVHEKFDRFTPIEYHFLDQQLESSYVAEKRASMIFRMGGGLSIFVACLGLLGLASYNIQRRTKELGIRKVFGASGLHLFLLLSSTFTKQVGFAFLIATPVAWYVMNEWLKGFEYRISLHVGFFLLAGIIALVIALASTSYRALKSAHANPLKSLRQE